MAGPQVPVVLPPLEVDKVRPTSYRGRVVATFTDIGYIVPEGATSAVRVRISGTHPRGSVVAAAVPSYKTSEENL